MADEHLMDIDFWDLDLNQELSNPPLHRVVRYRSLLNELETAHDTIEERIRQLELVTVSPRQQARNSTEISYFPGEMMVDVGQRVSPNENNSGRGKGCKRDSSHLVAEALEMESEVKEEDKDGGSFSDCSICLEMAKEPVLTCCGHLFCWSCFYQVSDVDSTSKECPVCKGEVSVSTVIPIYGNGDSERVCETESGLKIPPRPKAHRVESVRQQRVSRGLPHVPVAEALRRIRISTDAVDDQTQQEGGNGVLSFDAESPVGQNGEPPRDHRLRVHRVSRVLSESAASLSSLSSVLSSAERLVEDLEAVMNNMNNRMLRNDSRALSVDAGNTSAADTNFALAIASSSQSTGAASSDAHVPRTRASSNVSRPLAPPSSSFRRRTLMSRTSDWDGRDPRVWRRRRLN